MRKRLYLETTVVSYLAALPSRDLVVAGHQEATRELWTVLPARFETYISALVLQESSRGDAEQARKRLEALEPFPILDIDDEARLLAEQIMTGGGIPKEYPEDALHVAIAAANGIDIIVTWNFAHLNNPFTRKKIRKVVEAAGYQSPEICSPNELLEISL
jgi:predicted nucleic acid-binding protein